MRAMFTKPFAAAAMLTVSAAALAGCTTLPKERPENPPIPAAWAFKGGADAPESLTDWWKAFDDPFLNQLVTEAMDNGPSVQIAALRVREARALSRQTWADFAPQFTAFARGSYTKVLDGPPLVGSFQSFVTGGGQRDIVTEKEQMSGAYGPQVSWEIPLFQRIEAAALGSRANMQIVQADLRAAYVTLAADTAQVYIDFRAAQASREALLESLAAADQLAGILEISAKAGLASEAEAADARRLAETVRTRVSDVEVSAVNAIGALAVLRGRAPGTEPQAVIDELTKVSGPPLMAIATAPLAPADLVRARPDVAKAEGQALLAAADLGIARVEMLPRLNLTGNIGVVDNLIGAGLPERLSQGELTPLITIPLFDWGLRLNAARVREARFEQALISYKNTVNTAIAESGGALYAMHEAEKRVASARKAEAAAEKSATGARAAYKAGLQSLADRLRADQQLVDARVGRIAAEQALSQAAVRVYRTFAGGPEGVAAKRGKAAASAS